MTDLAMIALTFVFFLLAWLYVRASSGSNGVSMSLEYVVGLLLSLLLLAYLMYALLKPERF